MPDPTPLNHQRHASEGKLNDVAVDHELTNDGTVAELHAKIDAILEGHQR